MRQGEVWTLPGRRGQVLVVSTDSVNDQPGARPVVVPFVRGHGAAGGFIVATGEQDNVTGVAIVLAPRSIPIVEDGDPVLLSGHTMIKVFEALGRLFAH